jgi:hypothetical protein
LSSRPGTTPQRCCRGLCMRGIDRPCLWFVGPVGREIRLEWGLWSGWCGTGCGGAGAASFTAPKSQRSTLFSRVGHGKQKQYGGGTRCPVEAVVRARVNSSRVCFCSFVVSRNKSVCVHVTTGTCPPPEVQSRPGGAKKHRAQPKLPVEPHQKQKARGRSLHLVF